MASNANFSPTTARSAAEAEGSRPTVARTRTVSGTQGSGETSAAGGRASKKALRDYYGIQAAALEGAAHETPDSSVTIDGSDAQASQDPHDPDSPHFDVKSSYDSLISKLGLAELLRKSAELVTEIRELDGEKQSLVYNHHHELVAASETIRKMKARADGLDPSLDSLQASFSTMSQLAETLALPPELTASVMRPPSTSAA